MVFEKDGSSPVCNEILYGRAGYLYSLLYVQNAVSDVKKDIFIKEVRIFSALNVRPLIRLLKNCYKIETGCGSLN